MSNATNLTSIASAKPLHNPALPRVPITLNDQEYVLEFDFNAIAIAEEKVGLNLFGTFDFSQLSVNKFRAMLFASLVKNHPEITLEQTGSFIRANNLADITIKMVQAWHGSMPEVTDTAKDDAEGNVQAEEVK